MARKPQRGPKASRTQTKTPPSSGYALASSADTRAEGIKKTDTGKRQDEDNTPTVLCHVREITRRKYRADGNKRHGDNTDGDPWSCVAVFRFHNLSCLTV